MEAILVPGTIAIPTGHCDGVAIEEKERVLQTQGCVVLRRVALAANP